PMFHLALMEAGQEVGVHPDAPSEFHPIHSDDIVATVPKLLDAASVPATVVNWGGEERVSVEEWCDYLAEITGVTPKLTTSEQSQASVCLDLTRVHALRGHTA